MATRNKSSWPLTERKIIFLLLRVSVTVILPNNLDDTQGNYTHLSGIVTMTEMKQLVLEDFIDELLIESLTVALKESIERLLLLGKTSDQIKAIIRAHLQPRSLTGLAVDAYLDRRQREIHLEMPIE